MNSIFKKENSEKNSNFIIDNEKLSDINGKKVILNCTLKFNYYFKDLLTNNYLYAIDVLFKDGRKYSDFFKSNELIFAKDFKRKLASFAAGAIFNGKDEDLYFISNDIIPKLKLVQTIDYIGYSKEFECYIYPKFAVKKGVFYKADENGIINIPEENLFLKTSFPFSELKIDLDKYLSDQKQNSKNFEWVNNVYKAYGTNGIIALTFWYGTLFSEQIRNKYQTYPFLEMSGEASTGKTTLIEYMWKILGIEDREGFTAKEASNVGVWRNLAQMSNLPTVFIESDSNKYFNWGKFKSLFSGRGLRVTGTYDNTKNTQEYPFKSALTVVQNSKISGKAEILERFISLDFKYENINDDTFENTNILLNLESSKIGRFLIDSIMNEEKVLKNFDEKFLNFKKELKKSTGVTKERLLKNSAQILVLLDSFAEMTSLDKEILDKVKIAIETEIKSKNTNVISDNEIVRDFFDIFEYIENIYNSKDKSLLNHSKEEGFIAINLPHFANVAKKAKQQIPSLNFLREELKTSKKYKFVDSRNINSNLIKSPSNPKKGKTVFCWVFEDPKFNESNSTNNPTDNEDGVLNNRSNKEQTKSTESNSSNFHIKENIKNIEKDADQNMSQIISQKSVKKIDEKKPKSKQSNEISDIQESFREKRKYYSIVDNSKFDFDLLSKPYKKKLYSEFITYPFEDFPAEVKIEAMKRSQKLSNPKIFEKLKIEGNNSAEFDLYFNRFLNKFFCIKMNQENFFAENSNFNPDDFIAYFGEDENLNSSEIDLKVFSKNIEEPPEILIKDSKNFKGINIIEEEYSNWISQRSAR